MSRFGQKKIAKEKFYGAKKKKNIWDNNVNNIVASKSIETKTNSKYLIEYLDEVIKPSVLLLPKMYGYFNTFRDKD